MIHYRLRCANDHRFESWFASSAAFDRQAKRGLVVCPNCGSAKVERAIMAPNVSGTRKSRAPAADASPQGPLPLMSTQEKELRAKLRALRDEVTGKADNVGRKFPDEARKMHYGEIDHRPIYGEASFDEAKSLHDEGVEFYPLPQLPGDRN
ncbi:MAG: DUF1178 family protein [Xanthobacteraceae bacterium]|nr:MAG: DUF1178 family protein [Xanthobacteraceae bacterium]